MNSDYLFHELGPYGSYGGVRTTIRRRISIRIFLDRSRVQLKQLLHQKSTKSGSGSGIRIRNSNISIYPYIWISELGGPAAGGEALSSWILVLAT